jgi:hypothetical protein
MTAVIPGFEFQISTVFHLYPVSPTVIFFYDSCHVCVHMSAWVCGQKQLLACVLRNLHLIGIRLQQPVHIPTLYLHTMNLHIIHPPRAPKWFISFRFSD